VVSSDLVEFAQDAGVMEWRSLFVVGWVGRVRTAIMAQEMYVSLLAVCFMLCQIGFLFSLAVLIAYQESLLL
jgi:hypothetical protein